MVESSGFITELPHIGNAAQEESKVAVRNELDDLLNEDEQNSQDDDEDEQEENQYF